MQHLTPICILVRERGEVLVTKKQKLIDALRHNQKGVRFNDACRIAEIIGFTLCGGKGSHKTYGLQGESIMLNFQNRYGYIKSYQAKQLLVMVEKYYDDAG